MIFTTKPFKYSFIIALLILSLQKTFAIGESLGGMINCRMYHHSASILICENGQFYKLKIKDYNHPSLSVSTVSEIDKGRKLGKEVENEAAHESSSNYGTAIKD